MMNDALRVAIAAGITRQNGRARWSASHRERAGKISEAARKLLELLGETISEDGAGERRLLKFELHDYPKIEADRDRAPWTDKVAAEVLRRALLLDLEHRPKAYKPNLRRLLLELADLSIATERLSENDLDSKEEAARDIACACAIAMKAVGARPTAYKSDPAESGYDGTMKEPLMALRERILSRDYVCDRLSWTKPDPPALATLMGKAIKFSDGKAPKGVDPSPTDR
jgi:hypothetical protein